MNNKTISRHLGKLLLLGALSLLGACSSDEDDDDLVFSPDSLIGSKWVATVTSSESSNDNRPTLAPGSRLEFSFVDASTVTGTGRTTTPTSSWSYSGGESSFASFTVNVDDATDTNLQGQLFFDDATSGTFELREIGFGLAGFTAFTRGDFTIEPINGAAASRLANNGSAPAELEGRWEQACASAWQNQNETSSVYQTTSIAVNGHIQITEHRFFSDADCTQTSPDHPNTRTSTYAVIRSAVLTTEGVQASVIDYYDHDTTERPTTLHSQNIFHVQHDRLYFGGPLTDREIRLSESRPDSLTFYRPPFIKLH